MELAGKTTAQTNNDGTSTLAVPPTTESGIASKSAVTEQTDSILRTFLSTTPELETPTATANSDKIANAPLPKYTESTSKKDKIRSAAPKQTRIIPKTFRPSCPLLTNKTAPKRTVALRVAPIGPGKAEKKMQINGIQTEGAVKFRFPAGNFVNPSKCTRSRKLNPLKNANRKTYLTTISHIKPHAPMTGGAQNLSCQEGTIKHSELMTTANDMHHTIGARVARAAVIISDIMTSNRSCLPAIL
jgi:hypothetical protein